MAPVANAISSDYIRGIRFILDENVDLVIRLEKGFTGEVKVSSCIGNETTFIYKDIVEIDGESFLILEDLSFAEIGGGIEISVIYDYEEVECFAYTVNEYADAMTVQNMGYTPAYVKAFYTFVTLAAAYVE